MVESGYFLKLYVIQIFDYLILYTLQSKKRHHVRGVTCSLGSGKNS